MNKKPRDKSTYWQKHYKSYLASGVSQREYCRQKNISYWAFNPWKRKFEKEKDEFYEIPRKAIKNITTEKERIELSYREKFLIRIPDGFSEETLKNILSLLGEMQ